MWDGTSNGIRVRGEVGVSRHEGKQLIVRQTGGVGIVALGREGMRGEEKRRKRRKRRKERRVRANVSPRSSKGTTG